MPGGSVRVEGDKVVLRLTSPRASVLLPIDVALGLADALEECAMIAARAPLGLFRGEPWSAQVQAYDGQVGLRLIPPGAGAPDDVPMPADVARKLADKVREEASWARFHLRVVWTQG